MRGSGTFWPMAPLHLWSMTQSLFACPEQQKLLHPGALRLLHMFQTLDSGQARTDVAATRAAWRPGWSSAICDLEPKVAFFRPLVISGEWETRGNAMDFQPPSPGGALF